MLYLINSQLAGRRAVNIKDLTGQNLGRYHIIEPLGQGGMASVFKAYDTTLERFVAIKVIRPDLESGDNQGEFLKRFQREARALAKLDHPYILKVLDYGEQEGIPYLVMPFVPGGTLKDKMGLPMSTAQAASLLAQIAHALEYAHNQNIIHRDVKPANILISQSGAPLLSDFGIAKIVASENTGQLTATGVGIGTPDYMAPEQWMGVVDPGTDIYSLGVVFYEMVTGHRPFTADTPAAVLVKHLRDPLPRPKSWVIDLSDDVEKVLYKALAKEPKNRFQKMGEFAKALEQLARGEATAISAIPVDIPTMQSLDGSAFGASQTLMASQATTRQPIGTLTPGTIPVQPNKFNWVVFAIIAAVLVGVLCLVTGGGLFAARSFFTSTQQSTTSAATLAPGETAPAAEIAPTAKPGETATPVVKNTPTSPPPILKIDGLPEDVPLLTGNNGDLITSKNEGMTMYSFSSNLPMDKIQDFYLTGMKTNNWQIMNETTQSDSSSWYFTKDNDKRMVIIMLSKRDEGTQVAIMLPKQ